MRIANFKVITSNDRTGLFSVVTVLKENLMLATIDEISVINLGSWSEIFSATDMRIRYPYGKTKEISSAWGSRWEWGTNENTNGLTRQYFPKGTDFSAVSVLQLKRVQRELNDRPRDGLNYMKPDEVINQLVALKVLNQDVIVNNGQNACNRKPNRQRNKRLHPRWTQCHCLATKHSATQNDGLPLPSRTVHPRRLRFRVTSRQTICT